MKSVLAILNTTFFLAVFAASAQPNTSPRAHPISVYASERSHMVSEKELQDCCVKLEKDHRRIYYLISRGYRMNLQVKGIYARQGLLFFRLALTNHSHLDYDVDSIRFFMRDTRAIKKGALTTHPLPFLYSYGNTQVIRGKSREESVLVLQKFTLPSDKRLIIEVTEKNGGRKLQLFVDNFTLLRSRLI